MSVVVNIITIILAALGVCFMLISMLGLNIYPDFFSRLHVQGVGDTLGALLIVLAMMVQTGLSLMSLKIFLVFLFIMLTNPLGTNMMMIAAINKKDYQDYLAKEKKILQEHVLEEAEVKTEEEGSEL